MAWSFMIVLTMNSSAGQPYPMIQGRRFNFQRRFCPTNTLAVRRGVVDSLKCLQLALEHSTERALT